MPNRVDEGLNILMRESRFAAYVDAARNGRNALWRIVLGAVLIGGLWFAASFALLYAAAALIMIREGIWPGSFGVVLDLIDLTTVSGDALWPFVVLLSIASLWPGVCWP